MEDSTRVADLPVPIISSDPALAAVAVEAPAAAPVLPVDPVQALQDRVNAFFYHRLPAVLADPTADKPLLDLYADLKHIDRQCDALVSELVRLGRR